MVHINLNTTTTQTMSTTNWLLNGADLTAVQRKRVSYLFFIIKVTVLCMKLRKRFPENSPAYL